MVAITAETEGCGKVVGAGAYSLGSEVTLTAVADDGYEFLYWTGAAGETMMNPITLTADVAKSVTAHFGPLTPEFTKAESSTDGVALAWSNLAWAVRYNIYRAPSSLMPDTALATVVADGTCEYFDASGEVGQTYWYWVEAVGATDTTECRQPVSGTKQKPIVISPITYANLHGATHTNPETYQIDFVFLIDNSQSLQWVSARGPCAYFWRRRRSKKATVSVPVKSKCTGNVI